MADSTVNVLIFGIGGIGGVYAAILALSGKANVHVVARSNYDDLVGNGMKLRSEKFGEKNLKFDGVWKSCEDAKKSGTDFDYVICATKALLDSKPSLSDNIAPVISTKTSVVLLQNGVGAEEPLHASFPSTTIISAVVWTGGRTKPSEGGQVVIEQFNAEGLTIGVDYRQGGDAVEEDSKLDRLVKVLEAGGGSVTVTKDIQSERWVKVIWNCCWNSITAITSLRTNPFFQSSEQALPLCRTIMREVEAVAKAKGLTVPADTVDVLIKRCTDVGGAGLPSSMMADNLAGRPMEVEVILGTPVREAARLGVNAPTLTALYVILKALDYGNIQGFREQRS